VIVDQAITRFERWSMHYERAPLFRKSKLDVAPPPLRCAVQGFGLLRRGVTAVICPVRKNSRRA
jgi:hypothetical protein